MSKVSKTAREGDLARRFRHLLDVTQQEMEIFVENNSRFVVTPDLFFANIPLGIIYKDHTLEPGTDFNSILDFYNCDATTRACVSIELGGSGHELSWENAMFQASIRGREDLVEQLYKEYPRKDEDKIWYRYYPGSDRLVNLFVQNEKKYIKYMDDYYGDKKHGIFIDELDNHHELSEFLFLSTCFQEQGIFRQYYLKHEDSIPDNIEKILQDTSLKYNIDRNDPRLDLYPQNLSIFPRTRR
jgi:hypothetical protein